MRVIGIVAEFNPFHNGHEHLIAKARQIVADPRAIVMPVLSQHFTQRGLPAILPPDIRTLQALRGGADVVLGLPFTFSCAPSSRFAEGGIKALINTGVVTDIAFGYDAGTPQLLTRLAEIIDEDSPEFISGLKDNLSSGLSYPVARAKAITSMLDDDLAGQAQDVLKSPNSILAIEYLKALAKVDKRHKVNIIMIPRDDSFVSAGAIRKELTACSSPSYNQSSVYESLKFRIPDKSLAAMLGEYSSGSFSFPNLNSYIRNTLISLNAMPMSALGNIAYMGDDLSGYIRNFISDIRPGDLKSSDYSLSEFENSISTKRYTMTRIYRALASVAVGQENQMQEITRPPYVRVLGFNREGRYCLKIIGKCAKVPVISNPSDALEFKAGNEELSKVFDIELKASYICNSLYGRDIAGAWNLKPVML